MCTWDTIVNKVWSNKKNNAWVFQSVVEKKHRSKEIWTTTLQPDSCYEGLLKGHAEDHMQGPTLWSGFLHNHIQEFKWPVDDSALSAPWPKAPETGKTKITRRI